MATRDHETVLGRDYSGPIEKNSVTTSHLPNSLPPNPPAQPAAPPAGEAPKSE
jgi:hypothetical protein